MNAANNPQPQVQPFPAVQAPSSRQVPHHPSQAVPYQPTPINIPPPQTISKTGIVFPQPAEITNPYHSSKRGKKQKPLTSNPSLGSVIVDKSPPLPANPPTNPPPPPPQSTFTIPKFPGPITAPQSTINFPKPPSNVDFSSLTVPFPGNTTGSGRTGGSSRRIYVNQGLNMGPVTVSRYRARRGGASANLGTYIGPTVLPSSYNSRGGRLF